MPVLTPPTPSAADASPSATTALTPIDGLLGASPNPSEAQPTAPSADATLETDPSIAAGPSSAAHAGPAPAPATPEPVRVVVPPAIVEERQALIPAASVPSVTSPDTADTERSHAALVPPAPPVHLDALVPPVQPVANDDASPAPAPMSDLKPGTAPASLDPLYLPLPWALP
jgi:hypothetical protein